jgi:hypothetical protein
MDLIVLMIKLQAQWLSKKKRKVITNHNFGSHLIAGSGL